MLDFATFESTTASYSLELDKTFTSLDSIESSFTFDFLEDAESFELYTNDTLSSMTYFSMYQDRQHLRTKSYNSIFEMKQETDYESYFIEPNVELSNTKQLLTSNQFCLSTTTLDNSIIQPVENAIVSTLQDSVKSQRNKLSRKTLNQPLDKKSLQIIFKNLSNPNKISDQMIPIKNSKKEYIQNAYSTFDKVGQNYLDDNSKQLNYFNGQNYGHYDQFCNLRKNKETNFYNNFHKQYKPNCVMYETSIDDKRSLSKSKFISSKHVFKRSYQQKSISTTDDSDNDDQNKTTIMLRNIPNKYTQESLLKVIDKHFRGLYNFFYLPIDFENKCNIGYSFINFIHSSYARSFKKFFNDYKLSKFNSSKVCKVSWGRIQGLEANITNYQRSIIINIPERHYRPLVFKNGVLVDF